MKQEKQLPRPGERVLDHVGLFVPDEPAATAAWERLGFQLTPFTEQRQASVPGEPVKPAGTGNRLLMLEWGYLEMLVPVGPGPVADQIRDSIQRYVGAHLIAFGSNDAPADYTHLKASGFDPGPVVDLQRTVSTVDGEADVRFAVVRVPAGTMEEGRVQYCQHRTPDTVWQDRWIPQPNGAVALCDVLIVSEDPAAAAARFGRFIDRDAEAVGAAHLPKLDRGRIAFVTPEHAEASLPGLAVPDLPFTAVWGLEVRDVAGTRDFLMRAQVPFQDIGPDQILVPPLPELGVTLWFGAGGATPPWLG